MSFDLSNYVDVKTRIKLFYERYPDGSLQFEFKGSLGANIWGVAYAYRTPEDPRPATGNASELAEGKTAYTRGSELMNLETSAIGRAIGNLGIGIEAGMATSDEVAFAKERQRVIPSAEQDPWHLEVQTKDARGNGHATKIEKSLMAMGAVPLCQCQEEMEFRKFQRKSDGKWVSGYFCKQNVDSCKPVWAKD